MSRQIFIDSANTDDIAKWKSRIDCKGITTNQKIFSEQKKVDFKQTVLSICKLINVPVSIELTSHQSVKDMVKEAEKFSSWHKNISVKVPMTTDGMGLEVIKKLSTMKIKTNATLMVTLEQMILAISAGATYASLFLNRSKDAGYDPLEIIQRTRNYIDNGGYKTKIITGSIRSPRDVGDAFSFGSDIVTIPPPILDAMLNEKKTQETLEEFDAAWIEFLKNK